MSSRTEARRPTRLELHRLKRHFDSSYSSLIPFRNLSKGEVNVFSEYLFMLFYTNLGRDHYDVLREAFDDWGIQCYHPVAKRSRERERTFFCELCGCHVLSPPI